MCLWRGGAVVGRLHPQCLNVHFRLGQSTDMFVNDTLTMCLKIVLEHINGAHSHYLNKVRLSKDDAVSTT